MLQSTALALTVLLLSGPPAVPPSRSPAPPLAITHANLVDLEAGTVTPDVTVLVKEGRIEAVGPARAVGAPGAGGPSPAAGSGGSLEVDGRGRFLIPGLWDMHVHLSWTTASALPLLLANGITTVRDMGSDLAEIDAWRAEIAAGLRAGPRIVRAGPMLNDQRFNRYQLETGNPDQARGIVRALKQVGVDFIKVHRRVPRDAYFAIVDEARKQGLRVVGHIPLTVSPEEASDAGQLIEHIETIFEDTFSADLSPAQLPDAIRRFRADNAEALFARFLRNRTSVTPMLAPWRYLVDHPGVSGLSDPRMRYVARSMLEAARKAGPPIPEAGMPALKATYAEYREVVGLMNRAGILLLAGTDTAGARIPGFLLHEELGALVDAGLSPLEALRAATLNPAKIMGMESECGSVAAGRRADLVLLDANPLDDIGNTQRIAAVVIGGALLRRGDRDDLVHTAEEMAGRS